MGRAEACVSGAAPGVSHPRTPVEYFGQDEAERSTPSDARAGWHQAPERGFTLHGHRLSSLFRTSKESVSRLISGKPAPASSCRKYS